MTQAEQGKALEDFLMNQPERLVLDLAKLAYGRQRPHSHAYQYYYDWHYLAHTAWPTLPRPLQDIKPLPSWEHYRKRYTLDRYCPLPRTGLDLGERLAMLATHGHLPKGVGPKRAADIGHTLNSLVHDYHLPGDILINHPEELLHKARLRTGWIDDARRRSDCPPSRAAIKALRQWWIIQLEQAA